MNMKLLWIVFLGLFVREIKSRVNQREQCCKFGEEVPAQSLAELTLSSASNLGLCSMRNIRDHIRNKSKEISDQKICTIIARSCCLRSYKRKVCELASSEDINCESIQEDTSVIISQIKLDCCLCCQENNSLPIEGFDNCNLLQGRCPEKISKLAAETTLPTTFVMEVNFTQDPSTTLLPVENVTRDPLTTFQPDVNVTEDPSITFHSNDNITEDPSTTSSHINLDAYTNGSSSYYESSSTRTSEGPESLRPHNSTGIPGAFRVTDVTMRKTQTSPDTTSVPRTSTALTTAASTTTTSVTPVVCDLGYKWDPTLDVCMQMLISCPRGFIIHPKYKRCVPIVKPRVPCSKGFSFDQFSNRCTDIDECQTPSICANGTQVCVNKVGSYSCDCIKGFKLNKMGICEDIDECSDGNICMEDKKCINKVGSYRCIRAIPCGFGWKEDSETNECVDVDECETYQNICGPGMKCVNIRGSHSCEDEECPNNMKRNNRGKCAHCRDGYKMNAITKACEDIDECIEKAHFYKGRCKSSENCINLPGSYECAPKKKCRPGTLLIKNGTACEDIDECKEMSFRCDSDNICINTYSSYQCVASPCAPSQYYDYATYKCFCKDGYRASGENNCEDIDECADLAPCGSQYVCINKPGTYICINRLECPKGMYRPSMDSLCQDVDECETGEGKCPSNMHCVNMVGSYKCMCDRGFIMLKEGVCADINECLLFRPEESCPDLEARCVNTPGSYKCQCAKGFEWSDYPVKKCTDVDECAAKENPCGPLHTCINIIGSYKCQCLLGYRLTVSGDQCEDINECLLTPRKCPNGRCVNVPGRYICQCPKGYQTDGKDICQDIDECATFSRICPLGNSLEISRKCINLLGYYKCVNNSCPYEYSQTQMGNGYMCTLNKESHCKIEDVGCLLSWPYQKTVEFIEISSKIESPRVVTRINIAHLPPGNNKINLQIKYARHADTKEPLYLVNAFILSRNRKRPEEIDVIMKYNVAAPAEVLLYLQVNVNHNELYLGHSESFINLYFTAYPDNFV